MTAVLEHIPPWTKATAMGPPKIIRVLLGAASTPGPAGPPGAIPVVDSVAALEASSGLTSPLELRAYYAGNHKGGGRLWRDDADTTSATDFGTIFIDAAGKRWKRRPGPEGINSHMFGVWADSAVNGSTGAIGAAGDHDDTTALNRFFAYLKAARNAAAEIMPVNARLGTGLARCEGPVIAYSFAGVRWELICDGFAIGSRAAGKPAFDLSGSDGGYFRRLTVFGDPAAKPAVGLLNSRYSGTSDDWGLIRCDTVGEFIWAGWHNQGGENVRTEQCIWRNWGRGPCYGSAIDSKNALRWDAPTTATTSPSGGSATAFNVPGGHGMATGWKVYPDPAILSSADKHRWTVTVTSPTDFTIPVVVTQMGAGKKYYRARYWSDAITDAEDALVPYVGDGAFTIIVEGGQSQCPYGTAGIFDTPGGRRRFNTRTTCAIHDDPTAADIAIASVTAGLIATSSSHLLTAGNEVWLEYGSVKKIHKVATTPTPSSLTVVNLDGTAAGLPDAGAGGRVRKQAGGGYGIHFMGDRWETPVYENIHHEPGPGVGIHDNRALAFISNVNAIKDGTAPQAVTFLGGRFAEHTARGVEGGFMADTATVSIVTWLMDTTIADFSIDFGAGNKTGKMFVPAANWKIEGRQRLDRATLVMDPAVPLSGDLIDMNTGENISRRHGGGAQSTDVNSNIFIPHGCYKTPAYANARLVGHPDFVAEIAGISANNIKLRVLNSITNAEVPSSGPYTYCWEART